MITRYYRFMQLKATNPAHVLLIPTMDIEMIWQTHLLRPQMYEQDCLRLFHRVIDHSLLTNDEIEQFFQRTSLSRYLSTLRRTVRRVLLSATYQRQQSKETS